MKGTSRSLGPVGLNRGDMSRQPKETGDNSKVHITACVGTMISNERINLS